MEIILELLHGKRLTEYCGLIVFYLVYVKKKGVGYDLYN